MLSWSNPLRSLFDGFLWWLGFRQTQKKLLFLGIENAGKTSLMCRLKNGLFMHHVPTMHAYSERLALNGNEFIAYDIGGHAQARRVWKEYYPAVDAIVFIIDTSDASKLPIAKDELSDLLMDEDEHVAKCAIAVIGNKIDRAGALSEQQLEQYCELSTYRTGKQDAAARVDDGRRPLEIFMCSITANHGFGDAFRWLNMQLSSP